MSYDFVDFYIECDGMPMYNDYYIIEDDVIRVIIQKWEMIVMTNRGELFGDPDFGGDLLKYLHQTKLSAETIENDLKNQISMYISEMEYMAYDLQVHFWEDPDRYQNYMTVDLSIS